MYNIYSLPFKNYSFLEVSEQYFLINGQLFDKNFTFIKTLETNPFLNENIIFFNRINIYFMPYDRNEFNSWELNWLIQKSDTLRKFYIPSINKYYQFDTIALTITEISSVYYPSRTSAGNEFYTQKDVANFELYEFASHINAELKIKMERGFADFGLKPYNFLIYDENPTKQLLIDGNVLKFATIDLARKTFIIRKQYEFGTLIKHIGVDLNKDIFIVTQDNNIYNLKNFRNEYIIDYDVINVDSTSAVLKINDIFNQKTNKYYGKIYIVIASNNAYFTDNNSILYEIELKNYPIELQITKTTNSKIYFEFS